MAMHCNNLKRSMKIERRCEGGFKITRMNDDQVVFKNIKVKQQNIILRLHLFDRCDDFFNFNIC